MGAGRSRARELRLVNDGGGGDRSRTVAQFESFQWPAPSDWQAFERLCHALWRRIWADPQAQLHGRPGQEQRGVDIFGTPRGETRVSAVQCKRKDALLGTVLTAEEVRAEVENAKSFEPPLASLIIATCTVSDVRVQALVRKINEEHAQRGLFRVEVFGWREIVARLAEFPELIEQFYGVPGRRVRPFQAHQPPVHFVQRSGLLRELESAVLPIAGAPRRRITTLHGPGGAGKTTLVADLARSSEVTRHYPDGVLWVSLGSEPNVQSLLQNWAAALGERSSASWSSDAASAFLRSALRDNAMLLVIDDAWDEQHLRPFLVGSERCHVLITTRRLDIVDRIGGTAIAIGEMNHEESLELLTNRGASKLSDRDIAHAHALAEFLGFLPLALELIGALAGRGYAWEDLRHDLLAQNDRPADASVGGHRVTQIIEASLHLSLRSLRVRDRLAWQQFLWLCLTPPQVRLTSAIAANLWSLPLAESRRILNLLADDALLQRGVGYFKIHGSLHRAASNLFPRPEPEGLGLSLRAGHSALLDNYRRIAPEGQWHRMPDDGYVLSRLVWHMRASENPRLVLALLRLEDAHGSNAWYQLREQMEDLAGYVEDVRAGMAIASSSGPERVEDALMCALCISSIQSLTLHYSPSILAALVEARVWTAARAFQWIVEIVPAEDRATYLAALARVIAQGEDPSDPDTTLRQRVKTDSIQMAMDALVQRVPTQAAIKQMASVLEAVGEDGRSAAATRALAWCESEKNQVKLFMDMPPTIRAKFVAALGAVVLKQGDEEAILPIAQVIPYLSPEDRPAYFERILRFMEDGALDDKLVSEEVASDSDLAETARAAQVTEILQLTYQTSAELFSGEYADRRESSADETVTPTPAQHDTLWKLFDAISFALQFLPEDLIERATRAVEESGEPFEGLFSDSIARARKSGHGPGDSRGSDGDGAFSRALESRNLDFALNQLTLGLADFAEAVVRLVEAFPPYYTDRICGYCAPMIHRVERKRRQRIARAMLERNPRALGARVLAHSVEVGDAGEVAADILKERSLDADQMRSCIYFGSRTVVRHALRYLHIDDRREEASAVISLLPYLPSPLPAGLISELRNESLVGGQVAGLMEMMISLVGAIEAGCLPEVIEASSKFQAEWWIVEALIMTLRRIERPEEFRGILHASRRIVNLDLRGKLLGATALRLVDLGSFDLAREIATGVEQGSARARALREMCERLASIEQFPEAERVASLITVEEERCAAFLTLVLHLAAAGQLSSAQSLIERAIPLRHWRDIATRLIAQPSEPRAPSRPSLEERAACRLNGQGPVEDCAAVAASAALISELLEDTRALDAIALAACTGSRDGVTHAIHSLWAIDDHSFLTRLSATRRPQALKVVGALGSILAFEDRLTVAALVRTLQRVCRWWP